MIQAVSRRPVATSTGSVPGHSMLDV